MTSDPRTSAAQSLFDHLWTDYISFNPQAKKIYDLFLVREKKADPQVRDLINDHVALRTFNTEKMGLPRVSALFQKYGYKEKGEYQFVEKKLYAKHLEHADSRLPRVFISELETQKFSPIVQKMVNEVSESFTDQKMKQDEVLWSGRSWTASYARYLELLKESEYAAWVYAFGFRCNHFTISFNGLKTFASLEQLNSFVKENGYPLNTSGGEIKGTLSDCLQQSSTLAEKAQVSFSDGTHAIPACYYEFAQRHPMANGQLYQGFVAASADKIFESTDHRIK